MSGERRIEYVALNQVQRARRNPKQHDETSIAASLTRFGLGELPLIDERTGLLVAGEGRINQLTALRDADKHSPPDGVHLADDGDWLVPVISGWSSADDTEAEAYLIASNRLSERGGWDGLGLAEMLAALDGELDGVGYSTEEFDALMRDTGFLEAQETLLDELPAPAPEFSGGAPETENPFSGPQPVPANPFTPGVPQVLPGPQGAPAPGAVPDLAGASTEPTWFQLTWTASHEQRETIFEAIRVARDEQEMDSSVQALAYVARAFLASRQNAEANA